MAPIGAAVERAAHAAPCASRQSSVHVAATPSRASPASDCVEPEGSPTCCTVPVHTVPLGSGSSWRAGRVELLDADQEVSARTSAFLASLAVPVIETSARVNTGLLTILTGERVGEASAARSQAGQLTGLRLLRGPDEKPDEQRGRGPAPTARRAAGDHERRQSRRTPTQPGGGGRPRRGAAAEGAKSSTAWRRSVPLPCLQGGAGPHDEVRVVGNPPVAVRDAAAVVVGDREREQQLGGDDPSAVQTGRYDAAKESPAARPRTAGRSRSRSSPRAGR